MCLLGSELNASLSSAFPIDTKRKHVPSVERNQECLLFNLGSDKNLAKNFTKMTSKNIRHFMYLL